jgi:cytochrome c peroxidase
MRGITPIITAKLIQMVLWIVCAFLLSAASILSDEPVKPVPLTLKYDEAKALLGKKLFFDKRLSLTREVSCSSCHNPNFGMADGKKVSMGVKGHVGALNAPTVYNSRFNFRQFWNGRAWNLEEQASGPLHNPIEMDMSSALVEQRVQDDSVYRAAFEKIYGKERVTFEHIIDAIVEFENALITPNAKFDRYLRGEVELAPDELQGYLTFKSLGCVSCHNGVNLGGNSFQYLGAVNPVEGKLKGDRYEITKDPFDHNRFKVPTLRNIELTAPYLHDGSQETLEGVLDVMAFHNLGFRLNENQIRQLAAFLKSLTGERPAILDKN